MNKVIPTFEYVTHHARMHPTRTAIEQDGRFISYEDLKASTERIAVALEKFDLEPGNFVAVQWTTLYSHRLLLMAFEVLGVATLTFGPDDKGVAEFFPKFDLVLHTGLADAAEHPQAQIIDEKWFYENLCSKDIPIGLRRTLEANAPNNIAKTSGTTGHSRLVVRSNSVNAFRLDQQVKFGGYSKDTRYFVSIGLSVQSVQSAVLNCLRLGATAIWEGRKPLADAIRASEATHVTLLPSTLSDIVSNLPHGFQKPTALSISTIGSALSAELRAATFKRLATEIMESYSTNETGRICTMDSNGRGIVWPGVEVEVVDEQNNVLFNKQGNIRIRSPGVVDGYLDDTETSQPKFQDGWCYPGDSGISPARGVIEVLGRVDDLLNIGGLKILPDNIERRLRDELELKDVCASSIPNENGNLSLCLLLVPLDTLDKDATVNRIRQILNKALGQVQIVWCESLPRTATGKLKRTKIRSQLLQYLDSSKPSA